MRGAGDFNAQDLQAKNVEISLMGAADAKVNATESLTASIKGAGDIRYSGNPPTIKKSIAGAGSVGRRSKSERPRYLVRRGPALKLCANQFGCLKLDADAAVVIAAIGRNNSFVADFRPIVFVEQILDPGENSNAVVPEFHFSGQIPNVDRRE